MRLDQRLVRDGLADSRSRAQALIREGHVRVDGVAARRPGVGVPEASCVNVTGDACPWVSRAGLKLAFAFETFGLSPQGRRVLDLGASTGGFTEVCLAHGAASVVAVDVGHGQFHPRLRAEPRTRLIEGLNAKDLTAAHVPEPIDFLTVDLSFISLRKALEPALDLCVRPAAAILLVKPQFEAGRDRVGKGGVVKDVVARDAAVADVAAFVVDRGWREIGRAVSPVLGGDGNEERLLAIVNEAP